MEVRDAEGSEDATPVVTLQDLPDLSGPNISYMFVLKLYTYIYTVVGYIFMTYIPYTIRTRITRHTYMIKT